MLEQVNPDFVLTSSKSEDEFVDIIRDHSTSPRLRLMIWYLYLSVRAVDATGGVSQIRPFKEFNAKRGKERLYSLSRLSELPFYDGDMDQDVVMDSYDGRNRNSNSDGDGSGVLSNAYDFMRRRRAEDPNVDPTTQRWNALTRLANFANAEGAPLCVSLT